jgi:hypothetical protein
LSIVQYLAQAVWTLLFIELAWSGIAAFSIHLWNKDWRRKK